METLKSEQLLVIAGFALLLLNNLGRRRARRQQASGAGLAAWWLRWGDYIALGMVGAGLVGMMLQK